MDPHPSSSRRSHEDKPKLLRRRSTVTHISLEQRETLILDTLEQTTVGELTDAIGFGWYQIHIFAIAFGALMTEASIIQMVSSLVAAISADLGVENALAHAGFVAVVFVGIQVGTVISGLVADVWGRWWPMVVSYSGMIVFTIAVCITRGLGAIYPLLFFLGSFAGLCVPCALITLSEVMPSTLRGISGAAIGIAFRVGWLWAAVGLRLFIPDLQAGPWRWLMLWAAAPAVLFLLLLFVSRAGRQDTPHFLASKRRGHALVRTINLMAEMNGRQDLKLLHDGSIQAEATASSSLREMLSIIVTYPYSLFYVVMVFLFFAKEFVAGGSIAFWPVAFAQLHGFAATTAATKLIITVLISFPGVLLAMLVMHWIPRRWTLVLGASLTGAGALMLVGLNGQHWREGIVGVVMVQLFFPTWQMVTMLIPNEIFPTQIRGWAFSLSFFLGRFGSEVAQLVIHSSHLGFPVVSAALAVSAVVLIFAMPETKDCELTSFIKSESEIGATSGSSLKGLATVSPDYGSAKPAGHAV